MHGLIAAAILSALPGDAPVVKHFPDGSYRMDAQTWEKLDTEVKRLQAVEDEHKKESPATAVLVATVVGILVGAGVMVPFVVQAQKH